MTREGARIGRRRRLRSARAPARRADAPPAGHPSPRAPPRGVAAARPAPAPRDGLLILTFGLLAAGHRRRGASRPAPTPGPTGPASGSGSTAATRTTRPGRSCRTSTPRGCCRCSRRGRCCRGTSPGSSGAAGRSSLLLWTIHWAYRQRPLETAIVVALLGVPVRGEPRHRQHQPAADAAAVGRPVHGPGRGRAAVVGRDLDEVGAGPVLCRCSPRAARLWGLVFLAASALLSLATLPLTILQLQALFGFGARPLRLDYLVFLWALVPVALARAGSVRVAAPVVVERALARLRERIAGARLGRRVREYLGLGAEG